MLLQSSGKNNDVTIYSLADVHDVRIFTNN